MTADARAHQDRDDLFVADFYPQLGEYLAEQHAAGYDAGTGLARFLAWLSEHAEAAAAAEPVEDYLKQIGKVPGLNAEQEVKLAERIETGRQAEQRLAEEGPNLPTDQRIDLEWIAEVGIRAKNHLLEANLRLVVSLAKRYTGRGMLFLDLIQEGNLGLIRAVEKFDYTKGVQVLHLHHLVDPAGDHPGAGRPDADDPDPGPPGRGDQQADPGAAADATGPGSRADPGRAGRRAWHNPGAGHRGAGLHPRPEDPTGRGRERGTVVGAGTVSDYEKQMREYGYAAVAASSQAEAETGMRHNRLMFWLYRRMTGTSARVTS